MIGGLSVTLWISTGGGFYAAQTPTLPVGTCRGNITISLPPPNPNASESRCNNNNNNNNNNSTSTLQCDRCLRYLRPHNPEDEMLPFQHLFKFFAVGIYGTEDNNNNENNNNNNNNRIYSILGKLSRNMRINEMYHEL